MSGSGGRGAEVADLMDLLSAMTPTAKLAFARWCRDAGIQEWVSSPVGPPEETAAIAAFESGIEDLGSAVTPEIHLFFDPIYGEWAAWRAAESAIAALARTMGSGGGRMGELAAVLTQLQALSGATDRP